MVKKPFDGGAPPRTPLGKLTALPRPPITGREGLAAPPQEPRSPKHSFIHYPLQPPDTLSSMTVPPCGQKTVAVDPHPWGLFLEQP